MGSSPISRMSIKDMRDDQYVRSVQNAEVAELADAHGFRCRVVAIPCGFKSRLLHEKYFSLTAHAEEHIRTSGCK